MLLLILHQKRYRIKNSIIILGAARSGTYFLGRLLSKIFKVNYIGERNYIWKLAKADSVNDFLPISCLRQPAVLKIKNLFEELQITEYPILEKTPSNSLRPILVKKVFPDAKFIYLVRDGRDVVLSSIKKYEGDMRKVTQSGKNNKNKLKTALYAIKYVFAKKISPFVILKHKGHYIKSMLNLLGIKKYLWGPKFPGWEYAYKHFTKAEVAAMQWKFSVNTVLNFIEANRDIDLLQIKYEDLINDRESVLKRISEFIGQDVNLGRDINSDNPTGKIKVNRWKSEMDPETLKQVSNICELELKLLGYESSC